MRPLAGRVIIMCLSSLDMAEPRLLFGTVGKDASTVQSFAEDLKDHGGHPAKISEVTIDMSKGLIAGVEKSLPKAQITFDKFHTVKLINEAVEATRREEQKSHEELKRSRYLWLKNPKNLRREEASRLAHLLDCSYLKTGRAYRMKLAFQALYSESRSTADAYLKRWYFKATHSRLPAMIKVAHTVKDHWEGILRWFDTGLTTGLLEGMNSIIQAAKAKARGYSNPEYLITIAYLIAGDLKFNLPT